MTKEFSFYGLVQGMGFRPTAKRIANELCIDGSVCNSGGKVIIIAKSNNQALDSFIRRLTSMFDIKHFEEKEISDFKRSGFEIIKSTADNDTPFITPDIATCSQCEKELKDKTNRRYNHPFISCINCGPRYTIIDKIPYDRENTVMGKFEMCKSCTDEYETPTDRRCYAQTIACNQCGPILSMPIEDVITLLENGEVVAIKDIGGYHLCTKAENEEAVNKIRQIKCREAKPFAVMFKSIDEISRYCYVSDKERQLLLSPARPIVLLKKKIELSFAVCQGSSSIGAFLPCNPVQILITEKVSPLVMTSANISRSPIIIDDEKIKELSVPCLSHNRQILTPIDDSVLQINGGKAQFVRRARGYVPLAVNIGIKAKKDTLCLGGDLKAAFCYHKGENVFLSQYFGDLENEECLDVYKQNIKRFAKLHGFNPEIVGCDSHPGYYSSHIFKNTVKIQHHKAHCASVIAEHHLKGDVLCFAFDGTGYGDDGCIWGSEVFEFKQNKFVRCEHLEYTKMIASNEIAKDASMCLSCYDGSNELIEKAKSYNINVVNSSSMGRLFDAVSALLKICTYNNYEGECAMALERAAQESTSPTFFKPSLSPQEILNDIKKSRDNIYDKALGFHLMLSNLILDIAQKHNIKQIVLSGGVFNNKILTSNTLDLLTKNGFLPYINQQIPCSDSGIAVGQAFIIALED